MENLKHLRKLMQDNSLESMAIVPGPNIAYLTGLEFHLSERPVVLILEQDNATFILPELESPKISKLDVDSITYDDKDGPEGAFKRFSNNNQFTESGIESRTIRYLELNLLKTTGITSEFVDATYIFAQLRMAKSSEEIKCITKAVKIAENSLESVLDKIKPGVSEKEFASELVIKLFRNGSDSHLPFSPIVASGVNAANPHHFPTDKEFEEGELIIIDWGATCGGYFSDITRTFALGKNIDNELIKVYQVVKQANESARSVAKVGVKAGLVDEAARNVIEESGFGKYFTHRTGHGLGLEIHEEPYIKPGNKFVLGKGMTFTIEPGVYIPNLGGIRIEDDIYLETLESESLTTLSRELLFL